MRWAERIFGGQKTSNLDEEFERVRARAALGNLVIFRADHGCLVFPALAKDSVSPQMIASVEQTIPSTFKRNVAVIADTKWAGQASPNIQLANQAISFFGMLVGFTFIGHSVWVFNGSANLLSSGCRNADLLIVDSASLVQLGRNWRSAAQSAMRNPHIVIHDRATFKLRNLN
jgi:hypothetical protein